MIQRARGHVAVDGKLFAWHPVQSKARSDFCHAGGAFCNDHKVNDQKNSENHQTKDHVAAHDELSEAVNHISGSVGPCVSFADDQAG